MKLLSTKLRAEAGGHLWFWCPGCKTLHCIRHGEGEGPRWIWDGNVDEPTISPSILSTRPSGPELVMQVCHLFLRAGVIDFLGDCIHSLAGTKVRLPDLPEAWRS
jgi:phage FluMu protein Com